MKLKNLEWISVGLMVVIGVIHLMGVRVEGSSYVGVLFAANFLGAIVAAVGIYRASIWGWMLGFVVSAGAIAGYVVSRTVGMPGMGVEAWMNPLGMLSLVVEAAFIILMFNITPWKGLAQNL